MDAKYKQVDFQYLRDWLITTNAYDLRPTLW